MTRLRTDRVLLIGIAVAVTAPPLLTLVLARLPTSEARAYVFLYLGIVASLGLLAGLVPALVAAAMSSVLGDYFFLPPVDSLSLANPSDVLYLVIFFVTAGAVGGVAALRRRAILEARGLSRTLTAANTELERLYREQAASARTAVRLAQTQQQVSALREADRVRRELLQNVSHELRTPLASILTGATVLLGRTDLSEASRDGLAGIVTQSRRLDRLVGDMLDLARIEGHALELRLEPVDAGEAVEAAAVRLRRSHPTRVVRIETEPGSLEAVADWDRLGQVLDNLLVNADRYAPPTSAIEIHVAPGARGTIVTRVVDHGPGVDPELKDRIFERFVRDEQAGVEGTGLGLAIVRGIIEAHAGRIWLDDPEQEGGAVFAFTLPAAPIAQPQGEPTVSDPASVS
ncbi:MAG: sensor histidine kinase [Candidatus Dormibacteria bacterium]